MKMIVVVCNWGFADPGKPCNRLLRIVLVMHCFKNDSLYCRVV